MGQIRFHLHVSPMMSHAHSSSSSHLHMSIPSLSSNSSTSSTPHTTLPINKHCDDPQNEERGPVAFTTASTPDAHRVHDGSHLPKHAPRTTVTRKLRFVTSFGGHSGCLKSIFYCNTMCKFFFGWTDFRYRVGSSWDCRSMAEGGLIARGIAS